MERQIITTASAPSSPLYSQAVKAGSHVLVSGMVGIDVSTGSLAGDTIQEQTRQALSNCEAILQARRRPSGRRDRGGCTTHGPRRLPRSERGIRPVVPLRATDQLRRQARRRPARTARLNSHDSLHRVTAAGLHVSGQLRTEWPIREDHSGQD